MKRLFGQKPKTSKTPYQVNPIPTPVPVDEFARAAQVKSSSQDDPWIVVPDQPLGAIGPLPQNRSRSVSFNSVPAAGATNNGLYQQSLHEAPYDTANPNLLTPNSNHQGLKKRSTIVHGTSAILRSLDPEQPTLERSVSPSQESLQLNGEPERERDPRIAERDYEAERGRERRITERDYEAERERERRREWERSRERERERERGRERGRENKRNSERDRHQERDQDRGRDRDKDRDRPKEKEKKKGLFGVTREKEKEKERERSEQAELTRMIGYLTATASENWSLVLEVCERASATEAAAKDASKALRREFKYAEPGAQLSAARLWAIMLRNCSELFITQASSKKFLDTLEEVLLSGGTSPVVRERLLDVLAAAAFTHPGNGKEGYRALWKKVKPPHKPDEGIPFDEDDTMLNPSPVPITSQYSTQQQFYPNPSSRQQVISANEDMRRLFEECEIGKGNAQLLNQALTFARPDELGGPVIGEWYRKCRNSQDFIMAQIPWATAQAERSREELRRMYLDENGMEMRPIPTSKEEELLASLLGANQELLEAFRIYDDLERLGFAEQEEREVEERSRRETKLDRTQIQFIDEDGSFQMEEPGNSNLGGSNAGPSRSPSPSPSPSFSLLPPVPSTRTHPPSQLSHSSNSPAHGSPLHSTLAPPRPAPHGPRQARPRSRTPSPDKPVQPPTLPPLQSYSGSLGLDVRRLDNLRLDDTDGAGSSSIDQDGEKTPVVPSAKAMGKRKVAEVDIDTDGQPQSEDLLDGRASPSGIDSSVDTDEDESQDDTDNRWKKPVVYVYDAAADRARELRRDLGIPAPISNGPSR